MMATCETYELGRGYSVEFSFDGQQFNAAWLPDLPPNDIGRLLIPVYREARHRFLAKLAPAYGNIMVIDG